MNNNYREITIKYVRAMTNVSIYVIINIIHLVVSCYIIIIICKVVAVGTLFSDIFCNFTQIFEFIFMILFMSLQIVLKLCLLQYVVL